MEYSKEIIIVFTSVVYILAIINCIRILARNLQPSTALAWIVFNLGFPFLGVPMYYLLGQTKVFSYQRRWEKSRKALKQQQLYQEYVNRSYGLELPGYKNQYQEDISNLFRSFGPLYEPIPGNLTILVNGESTFKEIFDAISAAKNTIFVQYYIVRSDRLGNRLKDLLIAKAKEGLKIYFLYDNFGSFFLASNYLKSLKHAGIKVASFQPKKFSSILQINFRNHRKAVIVDSKVAFTGGLNVGEEYLGTKKDRFWRDTHVKIQGPAVQRLEQIFIDDWYYASKKVIKIEPLKNLKANRKNLPVKSSQDVVQIIPFGPNERDDIGLMLFMQLIQSAKQRIWISTPYFIPDETLMHCLELAAAKNIDLRLIIPKNPDHKSAYWVSTCYASKVLKWNAKIYCYRDGFLHQKALLIDDKAGLLGTANFDNRTLFFNFETAVVFYDGKNIEKMEEMLLDDMRNSDRFYDDEIQGHFERFARSTTRLLAPIL